MTPLDELKRLESDVANGEWDELDEHFPLSAYDYPNFGRAYYGSLDAAVTLHDKLLPGSHTPARELLLATIREFINKEMTIPMLVAEIERLRAMPLKSNQCVCGARYSLPSSERVKSLPKTR